MKANTPKSPKFPKSWSRLPEYERQELTKIMTETAYQIADKQMVELQEIWIKLSCIQLHDMGLSEEDLLRYIAGWKRMYRRNERCKDKEAQTAWLEAELKRCFPECGFPQFRIDEMKGE